MKFLSLIRHQFAHNFVVTDSMDLLSCYGLIDADILGLSAPH